MKPTKEKILLWMPRILAIFLIGFLAIFALDVFIPGKTFGYYALSLLMHLLPNFILLAALIVAWKNEKVGGILFLFLGVTTVLVFGTWREISTFLLITLPTSIIGALFLIHRSYERNAL